MYVMYVWAHNFASVALKNASKLKVFSLLFRI